jgi:sigma-B regulation protein RsbU (phosphoserine phosphatase)
VSGPNAASPRHHIRFPGTVAGIEAAGAELRGVLDRRHIAGQARYNVELAFDEIAANIIRYSRAVGDIDVTIAATPDEIELAFEDDGIPFDPRDEEAPPMPESLADARVGGLGLVLVRTIAVRMEYRRMNGQRNRLTLAVANSS